MIDKKWLNRNIAMANGTTTMHCYLSYRIHTYHTTKRQIRIFFRHFRRCQRRPRHLGWPAKRHLKPVGELLERSCVNSGVTACVKRHQYSRLHSHTASRRGQTSSVIVVCKRTNYTCPDYISVTDLWEASRRGRLLAVTASSSPSLRVDLGHVSCRNDELQLGLTSGQPQHCTSRVLF